MGRVKDGPPHANGHVPNGFSEKESKSRRPHHHSSPIFNAWNQSRRAKGSSAPLPAGSQRELSIANLFHALYIVQTCLLDMFLLLWRLHPFRTSLLLVFNLARGVFPAVRGYSRALILDEVQRLFVTESFAFGRLGKLLLTDGFRMFVEMLLDVFATHNEDLVQQSARLHVEYLQMKIRLKLDMPALSDPEITDILAEADMFVRSFSGGNCMLLSPLDMVRIFTTLAEICSQLFVLWSMSLSSARAFQSTQHWTELMILAMATFPTLFGFFNSRLSFSTNRWSHSLEEAEGSKLEQTHERMRNLAYSERFKREVLLFGMGDWILNSWAEAKRALAIRPTSVMDSTTTAAQTFAHSTSLEFFSLVQTLPLALQFSSASLGAVTMYRTTAELLLATIMEFQTLLRQFYQGIFLLGSFNVALKLQPKLAPVEEERKEYIRHPDGSGMKIEIEGLSYTFPGMPTPTLHDVNFHVEPGEVVAIVGLNGSGKSTFLNVLLRLYDFDGGTFRINDVDVRSYEPEDLHAHTSAVFQDFSQFNASLRENVGVGCVGDMNSDVAIEQALQAGGGSQLLQKLPDGLDSELDDGYSFCFGGMGDRRSLSGGEWQRVAISRAFMRTDADLYVFDEANSALDATAQNELFERITRGCTTSPNGQRRKKTVIFVTHRLSTTKRVDKIVLFKNGTVTEVGTHDELMARPDSSYAELYRNYMSDGSWDLVEKQTPPTGPADFGLQMHSSPPLAHSYFPALSTYYSQ